MDTDGHQKQHNIYDPEVCWNLYPYCCDQLKVAGYLVLPQSYK